MDNKKTNNSIHSSIFGGKKSGTLYNIAKLHADGKTVEEIAEAINYPIPAVRHIIKCNALKVPTVFDARTEKVFSAINNVRISIGDTVSIVDMNVNGKVTWAHPDGRVIVKVSNDTEVYTKFEHIIPIELLSVYDKIMQANQIISEVHGRLQEVGWIDE